MLTNLQKINSLPVEVQSVSLNHTFDTTIPIQKSNKHDITIPINEHSSIHIPCKVKNYNDYFFFTLDSHEHNGHTTAKRITTDTPSIPIENLSIQNTIVPPTATSITTRLMNQMKNLADSSTNSNVTLTSAIQSSSQPISTASYLSDYEITDTITEFTKKSTANIAAFPPRSNSTTDVINQKIFTSDNQYFSSKSNIMDNYDIDTPTSTYSNEIGIRFGTTPIPQTTSVTSSMYVNKENKTKFFSYDIFSIVMMMIGMMKKVDNII